MKNSVRMLRLANRGGLNSNGVACATGKVCHRGQKTARRHLKGLRGGQGDNGLEVYPCRRCGYWHVGHAALANGGRST